MGRDRRGAKPSRDSVVDSNGWARLVVFSRGQVMSAWLIDCSGAASLPLPRTRPPLSMFEMVEVGTDVVSSFPVCCSSATSPKFQRSFCVPLLRLHACTRGADLCAPESPCTAHAARPTHRKRTLTPAVSARSTAGADLLHQYVDSNAVFRLVTDLRFEDPRVPSPRLMIIKVRQRGGKGHLDICTEYMYVIGQCMLSLWGCGAGVLSPARGCTCRSQTFAKI